MSVGSFSTGVAVSPPGDALLASPALAPLSKRSGLTWLPSREVVRAVAGSEAAGTAWVVRSREPDEPIDRLWTFSEGVVVPALDSIDVYDASELKPVAAPLEISETPFADVAGSLSVTTAGQRFRAQGDYFAVDGTTSYSLTAPNRIEDAAGSLARKDFVQPGATAVYTGNTRVPTIAGWTKTGGVWPEVRTHTARWLGLPAGFTFERTTLDNETLEATFGPVRSTFAFQVADLDVGVGPTRRITGLYVEAEAEQLVNPDGRTRSDLPHTVTPILKIGSQTFQDDPFDLTGGVQTLRSFWPVNPVTRRSWTAAELAAFGAGDVNTVGFRVQRPASPVETLVNTATALYTVRVFVSHVEETRMGTAVRHVARQRDGWNRWNFLGVRASEAVFTMPADKIANDTLQAEEITLFTSTASKTVKFDGGTSGDYNVTYSDTNSVSVVADALAAAINGGSDFTAETRGGKVTIRSAEQTPVSFGVWTATSGIPFELIHSYSQWEKRENRDYLLVANVFDFPGDRGKTRGLNLRGLGGGVSTGLSLAAEFCDTRFIQGVPYEVGKLQDDYPALVLGFDPFALTWDGGTTYSRGDLARFDNVLYQSLTNSNTNNAPETGGTVDTVNWAFVPSGLSADAQPYVLLDDPDGIQTVEAPGRPYLAQIVDAIEPLSATIKIEDFDNDAADLDDEFVTLVDADENEFVFWFNSDTVSDPTPGGATSVEVETDVADTPSEVATKLAAAMAEEGPFIAFSSTATVTVRNKRVHSFDPPFGWGISGTAGTTVAPNWSGSVTYSQGDIVVHEDSVTTESGFFRSLTNANLNNPPQTSGVMDSTNWETLPLFFTDTYTAPVLEANPTNLRFACRSSTENFPASRLEVFVTDAFSNPALAETVKVRPVLLETPRKWLVVDVRLEDFGYDPGVPVERIWFGTNAEFDGWEILSLGTGENYQAFGSPLAPFGAATTSAGGTDLYAIGARRNVASLRQDVDVAVALGVSNLPPVGFEARGVSDGCVQFVELSWQRTGAPDGSFVEIQRQECEGDWQTVYNIYDLERATIRDYEIKRNTKNCYRARVVDNFGFASNWTETASALVLDDCCGYVFSSNRGPGLGVFYDDLAPRTYSFLSGVSFYEFESRDGALPVRPDADQMEQFIVQLVVAAKGAVGTTQEVELIPLERGRRLFDPLLVLSGDRRGDDGGLRRYPHICVADSDGNVWYASVKVETGVRQEPAGQYILTATVREITKSPQPVDVFATTIVEDVEIEFVDPTPEVPPVPAPPIPGNFFTLDVSELGDETGGVPLL